MTTPYEREILTHYYTRPGPWKEGSENWLELDILTIREFQLRGLLVSEYVEETGLNRIVANEAALRVYMDALSAVLLPVQQWVIPNRAQDEGRAREETYA